jgi:hypothetical protein
MSVPFYLLGSSPIWFGAAYWIARPGLSLKARNVFSIL